MFVCLVVNPLIRCDSSGKLYLRRRPRIITGGRNFTCGTQVKSNQMVSNGVYRTCRVFGSLIVDLYYRRTLVKSPLTKVLPRQKTKSLVSTFTYNCIDLGDRSLRDLIEEERRSHSIETIPTKFGLV